MKVYLFLALFLLFGCGQIENTKLDPSEVRFETNDASKLFFKNTRQLQYDLEKLEEAKLDVFRWKEKLNDEAPQLHLALVNNWRYDEAYLLLEPNKHIPDLNQLTIRWNLPETGENGRIQFQGGNKTAHAEFSGQVYLKLREGAQFEIQIDQDWKPIFQESESRKAFETTVYDFYRLTDRL